MEKECSSGLGSDCFVDTVNLGLHFHYLNSDINYSNTQLHILECKTSFTIHKLS